MNLRGSVRTRAVTCSAISACARIPLSLSPFSPFEDDRHRVKKGKSSQFILVIQKSEGGGRSTDRFEESNSDRDL